MADPSWTLVNGTAGNNEQWRLEDQTVPLALVSRHFDVRGAFFTMSVRMATGAMSPALDIFGSLKVAQAESVRELVARGLLPAGCNP